MTSGSLLRDSSGRTVFHPPEAVLYFQLSSRRRIVSVVLIASGFALAALLVAYGVETQENWSFIAAVASAVAGFASVWLYQSRVRPAQIAENRERANALFTSFGGRLEFGRKLAVTQEGVEVGGETVAWPAIYTIDAGIAEAMAKRITLVLDATNDKRRVSFSLEGLAEEPGVIYALIKMLWMRQGTARNVADFLPRLRPRRIPFTRTSSTQGSLWGVFGLLAIVGGIVGTRQLLEGGHLALGVLSAVIAVAVFILALSRSTKADWHAATRVEDRIDEMASSPHATEEFAIRRNAPRTWPMLITLLFASPAAIFFVMGDAAIATVFLFFGAVVSLIAWLIAWWMGSGMIATLTTSGIVLPAGEIPWEAVASIDLFILPKIETGILTLRLTRPRAPKTLGQRINSTLSSGASDREIVVSLARSDEEPAVILELVRERWRHALGAGRAAAAESAQLARLRHETRTWKHFSAKEKTRSLRAGVIILTMFVAGFYGAIAEFRMSDRWFTTSLVLSGALTAVGAFMLIRAKVFVSLRNQQGTPSYIAVFLILCVAGWMVIWATLGRAIPDVHARTWGTPSTSDVQYDKRGRPSSENCEYPLRIHLKDAPYRFCASPEAFASLPDEGKLRVGLRDTSFGVHIVSVSTIEN